MIAWATAEEYERGLVNLVLTCWQSGPSRVARLVINKTNGWDVYMLGYNDDLWVMCDPAAGQMVGMRDALNRLWCCLTVAQKHGLCLILNDGP